MEATYNPFQQINDRLSAIEKSLTLIRSTKHPASETKFYSIADAARKLNVAPVTLYRAIERGEIAPPIVKKVGTRMLISSEYFTG